MADRYRISDTIEQHSTVRPPKTRGSGLRTALWLGLFVSATANATSSYLGLNQIVAAGFGLVTLGFIGALITHHYRSRPNA